MIHVTAIPVAVPVPEPSGWPQTNSAVGTSQSAFRTLFREWGIDDTGGGGEACTLALAQGLRCYAGAGNLGTLSGLDRPAVLTLRDPQGREYYAALIGLTSESAALAISCRTFLTGKSCSMLPSSCRGVGTVGISGVSPASTKRASVPGNQSSWMNS